MYQLSDPKLLSQFFWVISCFGALFFLMRYLVLPPITKVMDNREGSIQNDIKIAENLKKELEEAISVYEASLKDAYQKAGEILKQTNKEIQDIAKSEDDAFASRMKLRTDEAKARILSAKEKVLADVENIAIELAGNVVSKLTLDKASNEELRNQVNKEMKDFQ